MASSEVVLLYCDILTVQNRCDKLSVVSPGISIASDNTPVTATFPEDSVVIKELPIPPEYQSGHYTVVMTFKTKAPTSVWADLVDQDDKHLWSGPINRSPDRLIASFSASELKTLKVRRLGDSVKLTNEVFEVYYSK